MPSSMRMLLVFGVSVVSTMTASEAFAADAEGKPNRILIEYVQPTKPENKIMHDLLKERRALEKIQDMFSPFRLQNELTVKSAECGMVNAWVPAPDRDNLLRISRRYLQEPAEGDNTCRPSRQTTR